MRNFLLLTAASTVVAFANTKGAAAAPAPTGEENKPADAAATTDATKSRVEPIMTDVVPAGLIQLPTRANNRGSKSLYPFESLTEVGAVFGVKNKTAKQLAGIISNANRKAMVAKVDAAGNPVYKTKEMKDDAGNVTHVPTTEKEMVASAHFTAMDVTGDLVDKVAAVPALVGSIALVARDK